MPQVTVLWWRVCKTVGSAFDGSNPSPATHVKAQVSARVSVGSAFFSGSGVQTAAAAAPGQVRAGQRPACRYRTRPRDASVPNAFPPLQACVALAGYQYGAVDTAHRHECRHRCAGPAEFRDRMLPGSCVFGDGSSKPARAATPERRLGAGALTTSVRLLARPIDRFCSLLSCWVIRLVCRSADRPAGSP